VLKYNERIKVIILSECKYQEKFKMSLSKDIFIIKLRCIPTEEENYFLINTGHEVLERIIQMFYII